jgi:hypothetical protein
MLKVFTRIRFLKKLWIRFFAVGRGAVWSRHNIIFIVLDMRYFPRRGNPRNRMNKAENIYIGWKIRENRRRGFKKNRKITNLLEAVVESWRSKSTKQCLFDYGNYGICFLCHRLHGLSTQYIFTTPIIPPLSSPHSSEQMIFASGSSGRTRWTTLIQEYKY